MQAVQHLYTLQRMELDTVNASKGLYITGCSDVSWHQVANCMNLLPAHLHFTTSADCVVNVHWCGWSCFEFTHASLDGQTCIPCLLSSEQPTACV